MSRHLDLVRSFLEQLEARDRREGAILAREFSEIKARSVAWKTGGVCSTKVGSRPGNTKKNRYKDVVPYDETRVILSLLQEEGLGDYINANFIRGTDGSQAYIATQGPLPQTLLDFWRLVWEFGVKVILMACQETENGRKKCERYWAQEQEPLQTGPFCITLTKETRVNADIILRTLQVTFQKESRSVYQLQYTSWPDHGVPSNPDHILTMVEEAHRLQGAGLGPLCVHCSAGCGRTGVLCAVDYVRQLLLTQTIPPNFSLFDVVLEMRKQRPAAVQTEEQYRFLSHTVAQLFSRTLQKTSPHYQNLKEVRSPQSLTVKGAFASSGSFPRMSPPELTSAPTMASIGGKASPPSLPAFLQNCAPMCKDASSLPATSRPPGGVLRSISVPGPPTPPMADTYAVVQKRGAPAGTGPGTRVPSSADAPIYSQVAPRSQRPLAHTEDKRGATPPGQAPADQTPPGPDAYEEVTNGAQTGGLGFNLRIGRPKGPRDPPAEWTRV
ncbi:tyrosine-protein phosphatase non-receptor type 18 isoform X1 [Phodopus roborovskii]|uniref:tyrosine-protein phosphatase non-receptor type 18 isoform X1 n=1 Tax=Phodopus roborovskii TaxID=109678 RepID=UPI0021E4F62A|nr:tyrosine-protein phosphatase non-receptor type 18 isoform X1 [Phodopus roborovskii]